MLITRNINSISPQSGPVGTKITLTGTGFTHNQPEEIIKAERAYPYDYKYIGHLARNAKKEKWIEAKSVDGALAKMKI